MQNYLVKLSLNFGISKLSVLFLHFVKYFLKMTFWVKTPAIIQKLISDVTWRKKTSEKIIYLTFDDGPIPIITPKILEILNQYNACATFFCVGENVIKHPSIYKQVLSAGHSVGNHTFHHLNGTFTPIKKYLKDVEDCAKVVDSKLFRPPYGRLRWFQKRSLKKNYSLIYWDVLSWDFRAELSNEQVLKNVLAHTTDGSIVLFHDSLRSEPRVLYTLPRFLAHFSKLGYAFKGL